MSQLPSSPESRLLVSAGLGNSDLERAFGVLLGPGIDFGDLYFQHARRESWSMEDGIIKDGSHSIDQGVGVRAISGEKTGFAYSDEINGDALLVAARSAKAISRNAAIGDGDHRIRTLSPRTSSSASLPLSNTSLVSPPRALSWSRSSFARASSNR